MVTLFKVFLTVLVLLWAAFLASLVILGPHYPTNVLLMLVLSWAFGGAICIIWWKLE
jgi:hypothetical protein